MMLELAGAWEGILKTVHKFKQSIETSKSDAWPIRISHYYGGPKKH